MAIVELVLGGLHGRVAKIFYFTEILLIKIILKITKYKIIIRF